MGFCDKMCGITLIQRDNDAVPGWRRSREFLRTHTNVCTLTGATGTGDLTLTENIEYLKARFADDRPMLVTGDGGFDVSDNFNNQESDMMLLVLSQTLCALETLARGGVFVLKIFDTFTQPMMDLLWILKGSFNRVLIEKPLTSRPANSEKYLICKDFVAAPDVAIMRRMHEIREALVRGTDTPLYCQRILTEPPPPTWRQSFCEITREFTEKQIHAILQTVELSRQIGNPGVNCTALIKKNQEEQRRLSISWCRKYRIPVHQEQFVRHPDIRGGSGYV